MAFPDQLGFTFQPAARRIWTVHDLIGAVRTVLEREYTDIWVEGEISNYRPAESGHLYFTLKDDGAQLRVVMFRLQARLLRFKPENGLHVVARGRVTIYEGRGELQLSAEYLEPKGVGALQVAFEQLKAKLAAEGLFNADRKKLIPALPRRIGLVTSPRGAALQDMLNILRRRHETVNVLIFPAQVQGDFAPLEVAAGVKFFNRAAGSRDKGVDVIIIARGGGSLEDLAAFNNEDLARTIAASRIPVISAVGHETDFTIADFVADLRAPTPSAAAELVIRSKHEVEDRVEALRTRLVRAARYRLLVARHALAEKVQHAAFARVRDLLNRRHQRLDDVTHRLGLAQREQLLRFRRRLDVASTRLQHHDLTRSLQRLHGSIDARTAAINAAMRNLVFRRRSRLEQFVARLDSLSPLKVLERGYALVFDAQGQLVKSVDQVREADDITAQLAHGSFTAKVTSRRSE